MNKESSLKTPDSEPCFERVNQEKLWISGTWLLDSPKLCPIGTSDHLDTASTELVL